MESESTSLVSVLLSLPIFQAAWVLWVLIALSFASKRRMKPRSSRPMSNRRAMVGLR